jgi:cysteinyl-tRNA synthetase
VKIYNTLTRSKEKLSPEVPGEVRMYVCGVTVYDLSHIGHARSAIAFDVMRRYLSYRGYRVRYVKNFTDIDDKIIRRAHSEGRSAHEVSEHYIAEYRADMAAVDVAPADVEPKATEHVPQMLRLIERLVGRGFAYVVDGDVYFAIRAFPDYGRLSGKNLDELLAGARVEVDERKRDPRDFALWKAAKPGEPSWESPWGPGRPGWHIECSAMAMEYLGESFDIHGGGEDLIFPHHECEIAQAEASTGRPFARYWAHNGFVNLAAEKMSKSLGNTLLIRELVKRHDPESLRLYLMGTHYRNPIEYADARIEDATRALGRLRLLVSGARQLGAAVGATLTLPDAADITSASLRSRLGETALDLEVAAIVDRFEEAMDDDFGTPQALSAVFDLSHLLNRARERAQGRAQVEPVLTGVATLVGLGRSLGILGQGLDAFRLSEADEAALEPLVLAREDARRRRDWKRADEIRAELEALGVTVEDTPQGPRMIRKATTGG